MLQQFSWGHFLIAMVVLNLVWYVIVVLVFYRAEVLDFLGGTAQVGSIGRDDGGYSKSGRIFFCKVATSSAPKCALRFA